MPGSLVLADNAVVNCFIEYWNYRFVGSTSLVVVTSSNCGERSFESGTHC